MSEQKDFMREKKKQKAVSDVSAFALKRNILIFDAKQNRGLN